MSTPFPDPIIKPFSNTGDNASPPLGPISTAANQETGFPILESTPLDTGGIPVTREEFNGAFNFYTKQILALVSGWRPTFDQALSDEQNGYPMGAVLYSASDNSLQLSLVNNNTANFITTPSYLNDGVNWSATVIDNIWCKNLVVAGLGQLILLNAASSFGTTLQSSNSITGDNNYILPDNLPSTNGQVLSSSTAGVMQWIPIGKVISAYNNGVNLPVSGTIINVTLITLPPGKWAISIQSETAFTNSGGSDSFQQITVAISTTSGSFAGTVSGDTVASGATYDAVAKLTLSIVNYCPPILTTDTTFYFVANAEDINGFSANISGRITAIYLGNA